MTKLFSGWVSKLSNEGIKRPGGPPHVTPPKRFYGRVKDSFDSRDFKFIPPKIVTLPRRYNLRPYMPPILDQLNLGDCVGNSAGNAFYTEMLRQVWQGTIAYAWLPSRLFIYYNARALEGTIRQDAGCTIRDAFKTIANQGVCPEIEWPYNITKFATKPSSRCYADALKDKSLQYQSVNQDLNDMRACLASGYPFVIGFDVYDSFESSTVTATGIVPMPNTNSEVYLGGHAVLVCGYDDYYQAFCVQNSWGTSWGQKGYFFMPYAYLLNASLSGDFWTLRLVS